jgi:hypothetical protein
MGNVIGRYRSRTVFFAILCCTSELNPPFTAQQLKQLSFFSYAFSIGDVEDLATMPQ